MNVVQACNNSSENMSWAVKDGWIYFKDKLYFDTSSSLIPVIVKEMHGGGHEGFDKIVS